MSSEEQSAFYRDASDAIYLRGWLIAKLSLDPDLDGISAKQVQAALAPKLDTYSAAVADAVKLKSDVKRLEHDVANLKTTLDTRERELSEARDLIDNQERGMAALRAQIANLKSVPLL